MAPDYEDNASQAQSAYQSAIAVPTPTLAARSVTSSASAPTSSIPAPTPIAAPSNAAELPAPAQQAAPAVAVPVIKAPPTQTAPLDMTRDAATTPFNSPALRDAGKLDVSQQIIKMLGALLLVLLLILGAVKLLRRFNLVPANGQRIPLDAANQKTMLGNLNFAMAGDAARGKQSTTDGINRKSSTVQHGEGALAQSANFTLLSSLKLPGSASSVHLVQAARRMLVLGTSESGGVTVLTDVTMPVEQSTEVLARHSERNLVVPDDDNEDMADDDAIMAFAEILREKAGIARPDILALKQVDERLSATQERLNSRMKSGAELSSALTSSSLSPRRRRVKTTSFKDSE